MKCRALEKNEDGRTDAAEKWRTAALREGSALQHGARELRDDGACERPWLRGNII